MRPSGYRLHLNAQVEDRIFMFISRSTTSQAFIFSKVLTSTQAASQYLSAKGLFIACFQLGFSPLVLVVLATNIKWWSQLIIKALMNPSKQQSAATTCIISVRLSSIRASALGTSKSIAPNVLFASFSSVKVSLDLYSCVFQLNVTLTWGYFIPKVHPN